jgi:serine/threonine protein kinase
VIGKILAHYEIIEMIGKGGMGEVYRARDTRLDRDVALKVLPSGIAQDAELIARFRREAKTISSLNHPHICTLYDVGEETEGYFLIMELIEGESLAERLSSGALPQEQVLKLGAQIADALGAAHKQGIVHRDLKPANVMLTRSGAKLLDFGLARESSSQAAVEGATRAATHAEPITEAGTILGTFQYMAPEQLEGLEADARTDIFAFGALLYEMATGRRAFQAASRTSLIAAIVSSQPEPISRITKMAPPALDHVVHGCLEKDPDDRWQSAHDVASQLRWLGEAGSTAGLPSSVTTRRKAREKTAWTIAGLLLAIVIVTNLFWMRVTPSAPDQVHLSIPVRTDHYVETRNGWISPDGQKVVLQIKKPDGDWLLAVRELGSEVLTLLPGTETTNEPLCWSPDGRRIALDHNGRIAVIDVDSGTLHDVTEAKGLTRGGAWNDDDVILFALEGDGIFRVSAFGGASEHIITPSPERSEIAPSYPTFLPDGNRFLYMVTRRDASWEVHSSQLRAGSLSSTETTLIGDISSNVALLNSGQLLHVIDGTLMASEFNQDSLELVGRPTPIVDRLDFFLPTGTADFSATATGTILFRRNEINESIAWFDASGVQQEMLVEHGSFASVDISPDGEQVVVDVGDPRTGTSDIWIYGVNRSTASRVTIHPAEELLPLWMPSGDAIIFSSDRDRRPDIFMKKLDGTGEETLLLGTGDLEFSQDISPDSRHILYSADTNGDYDLWVMEIDNPDGRRPLAVGPGQQFRGKFAPDGRLISHASTETGRTEIWVRPFPETGPGVQISTKGGTAANWASDQRILYFASEKKLFSVDLTTPDKLVRPQPRLEFEAPVMISAFDVASDGRFLVVLRDDSIVEPLNVITNWSPPGH